MAHMRVKIDEIAIKKVKLLKNRVQISLILRTIHYLCKQNITLRIMENRRLNRIKVVLVDKQKSNKWLAEQVGKDPATISKWVTNTTQPNLEMLLQIAKVLEVNVNDLVRPLE
jgi:DNA-binding Xre family transcriptional regulator